MKIGALWEQIVVFFYKRLGNESEPQVNSRYAEQYREIKGINFTAIFANKLTALAVSESNADIVGENARVAFLDGCMSDVWRRIKKITAQTLGTGGCAIVPYVQDGKILFNIVSQDRIVIDRRMGETITGATLLADSITLNKRRYYRWTDYSVENNVLYIRHKVTNESGGSAFVEQWADIQDHAITGVDRVLFAFVQSPIDNRCTHDSYGVPVTYGCDKLTGEIRECLEQIHDEFGLKEVRAFVDERMLKKDKKSNYIVPSKLFVAGHKEDGPMLEVFSPDIRDSSYYNRLLNLFELLEKAVGTSKGILTAPETRGATATEIKAGLYDTYSMITDIRKNIEKAINDYIYACNVLANYYGLAPQGEYETAYDWSLSLIESSAETWTQLKDAQALGVKSKAELRQWLSPNETMDEAEAKVQEIQEKEPSLSSMLGG